MQKILLQIDTDRLPSTFDAVVAVDAGVDRLLARGGVEPDDVASLVHGMMFTRGGNDLKNSAIFVGGSDAAAAEAVLSRVTETFFGSVRVSVMMDAGGCNTTAAAAVTSAAKHVDLDGAKMLVLGGTGSVGRRVALMAAGQGCHVTIASRSKQRATTTADDIRARSDADSTSTAGSVQASEAGDAEQTRRLIAEANIVIACGAAGVPMATLDMLDAESLKVAIDLNAVPPAGLGGISVTDRAVRISDTAVGYGAIGIGGRKMKIHKSAIAKLFTSSDQVLDAAAIYDIAKTCV